MKKISVLTVTAAAAGTVSVIYYILCGILYSFTLSGLWIWSGFGIIMYSACLWKIIAEPRIRTCKPYRWLKRICLTAFALFFSVFVIFECFVIAEWIMGCDTDERSADTVIVLGAAVDGDSPGYALRERIDRAAEYAKAHPDIPIIACGGLGGDDRLSEAECIKRELVLLGISERRIITESLSTTTRENFLYAAEHLPDGAGSVAVVTSGFHQLRAGFTARTVFGETGLSDITVFPVSADYSSILLPYSAVREFAAFLSDAAHGNIVLN